MVDVGSEEEREGSVEVVVFFFFKQKTAYEIYQCDWSSDVCSSDLPVSLEKPVGDEEEAELGDFLEDEGTPKPMEAAVSEIKKDDLNKVLESLPHRERKILELRYGLNGEHPRTLEQIGRRFGVTRERIRQIEANTLSRLKELQETQHLRESA